jgi:plastocyanin
MRIVGILASLGLLLATFGLAAPVMAGDPCFHDMSRPPVTDGTSTVVKMDTCAFVPTIVRVPVGAEVRFLNSDVVGHEVVGANLTWGQHDKVLASGAEVAVTFATAGVHPYTCMIHPGMTGVVIVGDAASSAVPPAAAAAKPPPADQGAPAAQPGGTVPASTASAIPSLTALPAVAALVVVILVTLLGAFAMIRRRRSHAARPTA